MKTPAAALRGCLLSTIAVVQQDEKAPTEKEKKQSLVNT